jgi:hypothetical protein
LGIHLEHERNVEILDGEYLVLPNYASPGAFIAEIHHVHRTGNAKLLLLLHIYQHLSIRALRDSNLPYIHPELPQALGRGLIDVSICSEPSVVHIHISNEQSFFEFGKVFHDDNE